MVFWMMALEGNNFRIRRRNAADTADIWSFRFPVLSPANGPVVLALRLILAANEFVVVENFGAAGAGVAYQASIFVNAG